MGADNWGICPKCKQDAYKSTQELQARAAAAYGQIPVSEYMALLEESQKEVKLETTLREDYEIGIDEDGDFYASYRGGCDVCQFEFTFKEQRNVLDDWAQVQASASAKQGFSQGVE